MKRWVKSHPDDTRAWTMGAAVLAALQLTACQRGQVRRCGERETVGGLVGGVVVDRIERDRVHATFDASRKPTTPAASCPSVRAEGK